MIPCHCQDENSLPNAVVRPEPDSRRAVPTSHRSMLFYELELLEFTLRTREALEVSSDPSGVRSQTFVKAVILGT